METKLDRIHQLQDIIYGKGGYVKFSNYITIKVNDDGEQIELNIMGLAMVEENPDFCEIKMIDSTFEMWSVEDYCSEKILTIFLRELATFPIEHIVTTIVGADEIDDKVLEYKDGTFTAFWLNADGDIDYKSGNSLDDAKAILYGVHHHKC